MNRAIYTTLIGALTAAPCFGGAAPANELTIVGDFSYTTEYVFRGIEHAGDSFQPSVELGTANYNLGFWSNQPVTKRTANEIDFYGGYKWNSGPIALEAVATFYWYPEARRGLGETSYTYEFGIGATYDKSRLAPSLSYSYDFLLKAHVFQGAIGYKMPFDVFGTATIDTRVHVGAVKASDAMPFAAGDPVGDGYTYWGVDVTVPRKLSDRSTLILGAHYASARNLAGTSGPGGYRGSRNVWFTAGVTVSF